MEFRSILVAPGIYQLHGYYDTGTQAGYFFGLTGPLSLVSQQGTLIASHSGGAYTYNSTNHDPFEV